MGRSARVSECLKVVSLCAAAIAVTTGPVISHANETTPSSQLESIEVAA
jgi:hypothetical protein